ncbi:hypothetical protein [Phenylobacterium sp.]|uniref:hypothetical protein n=1 Tax=Phenylobacterium sp. TaxID=1871053 RepID=UPI003982DA0B
MLKLIDQIVSAGLLIVGLAHVAAASKAFTDPTQARVWFLSAGLLGLVAGLANLARARLEAGDRLLSLTALVGAIGILTMGILLIGAGETSATAGPALAVLALGALAAAFSLRSLFRR